MSFVSHSYVLVCHPYATRMDSHVTHISLVCHPYVTLFTRMSPVYHSSVVYHKPSRSPFFNPLPLVRKPFEFDNFIYIHV